MEELQILGKVTYKQIVTDGYKQRTAAEIQKQIDEIDSQLADFDKQMSKTMTELTLKAHPQTEAIRAQLNAERDKINVYKEQFNKALAAVDDLIMGSEVDAGEGTEKRKERVPPLAQPFRRSRRRNGKILWEKRRRPRGRRLSRVRKPRKRVQRPERKNADGTVHTTVEAKVPADPREKSRRRCKHRQERSLE